jgi:hypothetical protein
MAGEGEVAAHLYRLALEKGSAGACYHRVADEGLPFRDIADVIGHGLNLPVVSKTQELLGWKPEQLGLISELDRPRYFEG